MRLSKIIVLLVGSLLAFTSLNAFSVAQKKRPVSHTHQVEHKQTPKKALKKTQSKKATKTLPSPKGKQAVSKTKKSQTLHHQPKVKKTLPKKAKNVEAKNSTQKQYGIKGATLTHVKVSNKTYQYRAKNKTHTSINKEKSRTFSQVGVASYYGGMFHGRKTASGEIFNKNAYTAAHKTLALGSYALVTNLRNGRKVIVRINDRGPFSHNRIIDLSVKAAREIGMLHSGIAKVKIEAMQVDRQGYLSGKGAESLYKLAKNAGLPLNVKGSGKHLAIKAK